MKTANETVLELFNNWNNIKDESQYKRWITEVKNTNFGTYGTISILDIIEQNSLEFTANSHLVKSFKNEIAQIIK